MRNGVQRLGVIFGLIVVLLPALASPASAASMMIENVQSGRCVAAYSSGNVEGLACVAEDPDRRWIFQKNSHTANSYHLVNTMGQVNMCLEQDATPNAATVRVSWCNGSRHQSWHISFAGPGNTYLNLGSNKCLGSISRTVGAFACDHSQTQQWYNR